MKKKNSLIGHNKPPRKHNYPKHRKPIRQKVLNANWRAWKRKTKRFNKWKKRMDRIDKTIQKHRQKAEEKAEKKRLKDKEKKKIIRPRDITWIAS